MVKQQIIKNSQERYNYDLCFTKKHENKLDERVIAFSNHKANAGYLFHQLDKEAQTRLRARSARELIVPIPQSFGNDKEKMKSFMRDFMLGVGIDHTKNSTLYVCSIHKKYNDKGKLNIHAHLLFSERPLLDKPIIKHMKERYFDKTGRQCLKRNATQKISAYDKKIFFGKKYKNNEGKEYFNSKDFCKKCDIVWNKTALAYGLTEKDIKQIHSKSRNLKSLGNETKAIELAKKGYTISLENRIKKDLFNERVKQHDQEIRNYKKYSNIDKSKLSPIDLVRLGNIPRAPSTLDLSKLWKEIEQQDIQNKVRAIIQEVREHEKSYEEAETEINELELDL